MAPWLDLSPWGLSAPGVPGCRARQRDGEFRSGQRSPGALGRGGRVGKGGGRGREGREGLERGEGGGKSEGRGHGGPRGLSTVAPGRGGRDRGPGLAAGGQPWKGAAPGQALGRREFLLASNLGRKVPRGVCVCVNYCDLPTTFKSPIGSIHWRVLLINVVVIPSCVWTVHVYGQLPCIFNCPSRRIWPESGLSFPFLFIYCFVRHSR